MIQGLKPYRAMKDFGVPWLGAMPEHWKISRVKHVAQVNPNKSEAATRLSELATFLPMERVGSNGRIDPREQRPISHLINGFTCFRRDDVIVAKITPCFENGKGACLDQMPTEVGFGSTEFVVLRAGINVFPHFLYRLTTEAEFRKLVPGLGREGRRGHRPRQHFCGRAVSCAPCPTACRFPNLPRSPTARFRWIGLRHPIVCFP